MTRKQEMQKLRALCALVRMLGDGDPCPWGEDTLLRALGALEQGRRIPDTLREALDDLELGVEDTLFREGMIEVPRIRAAVRAWRLAGR